MNAKSEVLNELEEDGEIFRGPLGAGLVPKTHSRVGDRVSHFASK